MRKYIRNAKFLGLALFSIIATISCEVGLGASVDTERPALSITYPPKGSIVMDTFTLAGTVSDDIGVSYINVTLTHKTLKTEYVYKSQDGQVTIEQPSGKWSQGTRWTASIGKKEEGKTLYNGWDLPDGDYFIDVEANDGIGSVYDRRSIRIDNTAPVFISENLTSLGTTAEDKLSTFGQKINLKGQAKDDSEISKVFFDVYHQNQEFVGSRSLDYEMTSDGILLAKYSKVIPSTENEKILAENYNLIYGLEEGQNLPENATEEDKKHPYLVIRFADNARIYDSPVFEGEDSGRKSSEGRGEGNISTELFLNTQAFGLEYITIDSLNDYQKKLTENTAMQAKLAGISASSIADTKAGTVSDFGKVNKIVIDPNINPTWNIDSFEQANEDFNQAYLESGLTVMFACGNDSTEFLAENICILLEKVEETDAGTGIYTSRKNTDEQIKEWAEKWTSPSNDTSDLIMLKKKGTVQDGNTGKLVTAYVHDVKLDSPKLVVHGRYRLVVLGNDTAGYEFSEQNRSWYGVQIAKEAAAPEIRFKNETGWVEAKEAEGAWLGPDTSAFTFEFKVTTAGEDLAAEYPKVSYTIADSNGLKVDAVEDKYVWEKEVNPVSREPSSSSYEYKWILKNAAGGKFWMPSEEGNYKLIFTVEAQDKVDGYTTATYKLNIDRKSPAVTVKEVNPYIEDGYINGTVTVPVSFSDAKGIAKTEYTIQWDSIRKESKEIELDSTNSGVITINTLGDDNTSKVSDGSQVTLKVSATDVLGNTKTESVNFIVDQSTDKPKLELNLDDTGVASLNSFGLTSGNQITVNVTDDDGINDASCLKVKVWGIGENNTETLLSDWKPVTLTNGKVLWNYYDTGIITKDGKYQVQFEATDKIGNLPSSKTLSQKYAILVDGTAPKFSEEAEVKAGAKSLAKESGKYYVSANAAVTIGFALEEGNLSSLKANTVELLGTNACKLAEGSTTDWNVSYVWNPGEELSGEKKIVFTAEDDSGNKKEKEFKLFYDKDIPEIKEENLNIYPVLGTGTVNGTLYIEGKATDNDKVAVISATVSGTGTDGEEKNNPLFTVETATFGKTETVKINTTEYIDNTDITVKFVITDRSGNSNTVTKTYSIDQSSDIPVLEVGLNAGADPAANYFKLNSENTISVKVSDDDGISNESGLKVKVWETGSEAPLEWKNITLENGKANWNFKDSEAITSDGKYNVQFEATDIIGTFPDSKKTSAVYAILVDGTSPEFTDETVMVENKASVKENGKYYTPKDKNVVIRLGLTEANLKSVKAGDTELMGTSNCTLSNGVYNVSYSWMPGNSETAGDKKITLTAEDISGNKKEKEIKLYYDTTSPSIEELKVSPVLNSNVVNGLISVEGKASDNDRIANISGTVSYTAKDGSSKTDELFTVDGSSFGKTEAVTIRTADYKDNTDVTVNLKVTDRSGNTTTDSKTYRIDQNSDKPVLTIGLTEGSDPKVNHFKLNSENTIAVSVKDDDGINDASCLKVKAWKTGTAEPADWTAVTLENGKVTWNFKETGVISDDGKYNVKFQATDKIGLFETSKSESAVFAILVDGTAPVFSEEPAVKVAAKDAAKLNGKYFVPKDTDAVISFTVTDENLSTVKAGETPLSNANGVYTYTWNHGAEATGDKEVIFTAEDISGNRTTKKVKLYYDAIVPTVDEFHVYPVLGSNTVNGNIYVYGKASDNNTISHIVVTTAFKNKDGNADTESKTIEASSVKKEDALVFDTTNYEDGESLTVTFTAFDRAGNSNSQSTNYSIDQSTDKPVISFDSTKYDTLLTDFGAVESANKNMFGLNTNNILTGTVSDDDGVGEVVITVPGTDKKAVFTGKTTFNCNLKDDLGIDKAGNYVLKINATDDVNKTKLAAANKADEKTLYIVVDGVAPAIQAEKVGETAYTGNIPVKGNFKLSFDVEEAHLSQVTVKLNNNVPKTLEKKSFDSTTGISHFEEDITLRPEDKDSVLSIKIFAEDRSGLNAEKELYVYYDATAPEINTTITRLLKGNNVNGNITISGTVKDEAGSGVASGTTVELFDSDNNKVDKLVSGKANSDTGFTYTVNTKTDLTDGNTYTLKVTAKDKAGNPAENAIVFTVDQSTDNPTMTFVNAAIGGTNVFGSSGWTINFAAEDDDGPVIVKVGDDVVTSPYTITDRTSGEKTVTFNVTENYSGVKAEDAITKSFVLNYVVDTKSPEYKKQTLNGTTYYEGMFVPEDYSIVFTVDDDNGFTVDADGNVTGLEYKSGENWISTGITYSEDDDGKYFTHSYTGAGTSSVTTEYRLTDKYGFTSTKTLKYEVDSDVPDVENKTIKIEKEAYAADTWFNKGQIQIDVSGITDMNLNGTVAVSGASAQSGETFVMDVKAGSPKTGSISQIRNFADGANTVKYTVKDDAGNTNDIDVVVKVDTTAPAVSKVNADTEYLSASDVINGGEVKVNFKASDGTTVAVSGLDEAVLGPKAGFADSEKYAAAIDLSSNGTVTDEVINFNEKVSSAYKYAEGKHEIWVRVTDNVGNKSETKLGEFILDRTPPKVEYTSHTENATVNKTITLSGTVKEDYWPTGTVNAVLKYGETEIESAELTGEGNTRSWTFTLDTTAYTGSNAFVVEVEDAAKNASTDAITLNIDQDSDRPVIILDSINVTGTTSTLASGKIEGTVTDDDGIAAFAVKVMRKGKDADGNDEWQNVEGADSGWKTLTLDGGKFSYPEEKDAAGEDITLADGTYKVDFKVTDTALPTQTNFDTTSTTKPKVLTKGSDSVVSTAVSFDVDGERPVINDVQVQVSSDGIKYGGPVNFVNGVHYGGTKKRYAKLIISASDNVLDESGLKVYVSVNGTKSERITYNNGFSYVIDFNEKDSGSVPVEILVEDNTGVPATKLVSVSCDNSAPNPSNAIANFTPLSDDEVTGVVAISGTVNDDNEANSGINNVKYYVPLTTETAPAQDGDWSEFNSKWSDTGVTLTDIVLRIDLDGLSSNTVIDPKYSEYEIGNSEIYQIPVWFRVEDNCGNVCYVTDKSIRYNPNAARPKIKRTYPKENAVNLGGTIRMAGTAEDDVDVDSIYVQYDVNADGAFTPADAIALSGAGIPIYNAQTATVISPESVESLTDDVTWGVKAEGSRSWNAEFDAKIDSLNLNGQHLKVRMTARDKDQNTLLSAWSDVLDITVNNNVPQFGKAYLVQYTDNTYETEEKRVEYSADIYVKGENWRLEVDVTDSADIKAVVQDNNPLTLTGFTRVTEGGNNIGYSLKLPVTPVNGKFNTTVRITNGLDTNPQDNKEGYFVNIDNDAPAFEDGRGDNDLVLYAGDYGRTKLDSTLIQNSNGYSVISGKVNEAGSGFARAVFYLERFESKDESGDSITYKNRRLYNVMTGGRIDLTDASSINDDGLPVIAEKDATKVDNYKFTVSYTGSWDANITAGSLVYIGNVYKTITDITDDENGTVTIEVSEKINSAWDENDQQKVQFVYAFAVDKSGETRDSSGNEKGGDGDGLVENYTKSGTNYTWEVSFDSSVIPDGPATVHVVVFDVAGNSRHGIVNTRVGNNAPRITSVKLGTDLNHSGFVEEKEYTRFYAYKNNWGEAVDDQGKDVWNLIPSRETESLGKNWKVVSGLRVVPEFVGGNGNIHYVFSKAVGTGAGTHLETAEKGTATKFADYDSTEKELTVSEISLNDAAIGEAGEDGINTFRFSFWDSTEESTPGRDSGSCVLNVELYQDLVDDKKPTAYVHPFFWNKRKANNNSVAWDANKPLGHIELEDDWRSAAYDNSNGTYTIKSDYNSLDENLKDLDPKVSGTIVIRGTAYDETVLSKLVVTFDGIIDGDTTKCESEYKAASGKWDGSNISGTGFSLEVTDRNGGVTQDGHFVDWKLTLDTSKIVTGTDDDEVKETGLDKKVYVTAKTSSASNNTSVVVNNSSGVTANAFFYATEEQAALGKYYASDTNALTHKDDYKTVTTDQTVILDRIVEKDSVKKLASGTNPAVNKYKVYGTNSQYQMDIVPYVTEVVTSLSSMNESYPSVYDRTATGHYPVQSVVSNVETGTLNNSASESITLKGFNLNGNVEVDGDSKPTVSEGQIQISAATLYSKALDCKVNGIPLMNNLNNNNASGSYKGKKNSSGQLVPVSDASADYDELYTYAYNRVPNGDNNNRLTDDIIFDVWEFNDRVVKPSFNSMGGTTMQVNSHNGLIQYAYSDGTIFAMANSNNDRNGEIATSSTSWARGWDTIQEPSVGFHVDASGETVGAGQPGDTSKDDAIDAFALMTSRWGFGYSISSPGFMQYHTNLKFLETTGENRDSKLVINRQRFQSPAFASTKTTNSVNLYMVYYDAMHDEIRFRAGEVPANDGNVTQPNNDTPGWNMPDYDNGINYRTRSESESFGMFIDSALSGNVISTPTWGDKRNSQVIASSSITNKGAGQYTSVAVSKNASSQDVVSAVWFDKGANALRYSYIENPLGKLTKQGDVKGIIDNTEALHWTGNKTLFQNAGGGEYCQIVSDVNGGIHVVAYAGNGYLYYAYAPNYSTDFTECIVDATDGVGQHATLDVALNSAGNPIPYIGYYSTTGKAKHAYLTDAAAAVLTPDTTADQKKAALAGVDSNMTYTGAWESSIIPSKNTLSVRREDKINVGVWKETSGTDIGKIKASTPGKSTYGKKAFTIVRDGDDDFNYDRNYSVTYGNGTANDVLLYQIVDSTGSKLNCLESAQLRASQ